MESKRAKAYGLALEAASQSDNFKEYFEQEGGKVMQDLWSKQQKIINGWLNLIFS